MPEKSDNYRNGSYHKFVKTKNGKLGLVVPRDRKGEFEPQVVKKHQSDIFKIKDKIWGNSLENGTKNMLNFKELECKLGAIINFLVLSGRNLFLGIQRLQIE